MTSPVKTLSAFRDAVLGTVKDVAESAAAGAITSASRELKKRIRRFEAEITKVEDEASPKANLEKKPPPQLKR